MVQDQITVVLVVVVVVVYENNTQERVARSHEIPDECSLAFCHLVISQSCHVTDDCSPSVPLACSDPPPQGRPEEERKYSTPNAEWEVLSTFISGEVIEMDIVMIYFH